MALEKGRPADCSGRLDKEIKSYDFLESLGIEFYRLDHEPADNMDVCDMLDRELGAVICKNLFLCNKQQTKFYMLMLPAHKKFKTKELTSQINSSRLSFAGADKMMEYINITPGSVSILGLMFDTGNNVQLLVDEDLINSEYVGIHPCINTSSLRIRSTDMFPAVPNALHHPYQVVKLSGEGNR